MVRCLAFAAALFCAPLSVSVSAQEVQTLPSAGLDVSAPELHGMLEALGLYDLLAIMATENARGAANLEEELFPGRGGAAWVAVVTRIHSTDRIVTLFEDALSADAFSPDDIAALDSFFRSEVGAQIVAGELAARRAFLDEDAQEAADDALMDAVEGGDDRLVLLERFNAVNELVDRNVTAALNATYAFYRGLSEGGAFHMDMSDDLMIADVWAQEAEVRRSTVEWLYGYQLTAYGGLSDTEFERYIDLSETPAGMALNTALFQAFETVLTQLSYELGEAAAGFMVVDDI